MLSNYAYLLVFLLIGAGFVIVNSLLPLVIAPRSLGTRAKDPYESGEIPIGSAWIRFDINYYVFALMFVAFDVEVVFLFPVLVAYRQISGWLPFVEVTLFLSILSFAILYAWRKGVFLWK